MGISRHTKMLSPILPLTTLAAFLFAGMGPGGTDSSRTLLGHIAPRSASEIAGSPWGIQTGSLERDHMAKAAEIGVKWTRLSASWRDIERVKGEYRWKETDDAFASALEEGITPFVCLSVSNRLYCKEVPPADPREREVYGSNPLPPTKDSASFQAWLHFVRAAVERYRGKIRYWEVWNEPNHSLYWGAPPDGADYGRLLRESARVIRQADPSAKVIGGALAGLDPEFTDKFLAGGTAEMIDIITFHNYAALPEERIYKATAVWDVIRKHRPDIELWQGECGYPSHSSTKDYRGISPWGVMIQAKWLLRQSFTDIYYCRATLSNYFKLVHEGGRGEKPKRSFLSAVDSILGFPERGGSRVKSVGVNEKCLLESPGLNPKPAYHAYRNLCALFDNRYTPFPSDARLVIRDAGVFYGVGEEDDAFPSRPLVTTFRTAGDRYLVAYWLPWHPQEIIREGRVDMVSAAVKFKEPVLVDLLDGEVYSLQNSRGDNGTDLIRDLPLADYPFIIVERGEVALQ